MSLGTFSYLIILTGGGGGPARRYRGSDPRPPPQIHPGRYTYILTIMIIIYFQWDLKFTVNFFLQGSLYYLKNCITICFHYSIYQTHTLHYHDLSLFIIILRKKSYNSIFRFFTEFIILTNPEPQLNHPGGQPCKHGYGNKEQLGTKMRQQN